MLAWDELHPYNAVHVVRILEPFEVDRLRLVINATLQNCGLTNLALHAGGSGYCFRGGSADCEIRVVARPHASRSLSDEIEYQLNTPFVRDAPMNPFRFFVEPANDSFQLGLAYFHPVADADAIVRLLVQILAAYEDKAHVQSPGRMEVHPARHDRLIKQPPTLIARKVAALMTTYRDLRKTLRPACRDTQDLRNCFLFYSLEPEVLRLLLEASRRLDVTLHDLFLALLMKGLSPLAAARRRKGRRQNISLGTIVNLRRDLGPAPAPDFGLRLGSFIVTHPAPEGAPLAELAQAIRQQTARIKERKLYLAPPLELLFGRWILRFFSRARRNKLYPKYYPLWGGITNLNLNPLRKSAENTGPADYFRAVSTGPVTPLVLSITTVRDMINVGVTYRPAIYPPAEIERVRQRMLDAIQELRVSP
jgi:hypothetical protein